MSRFRRIEAAFLGAACGCLLGWIPTARAAVPTAEDLGLDDQIVDVWETAQGLPQSTVTAITQTRDGYLWVGTLGGLACFDGNRFQVFDSQNTPGLRSNHITALGAGTDGSLWIGTSEGGACHLFQGRFESLTTAQGLADDDVRSFGFGADGGVWIGTAKGLSVSRDGRVAKLAEGGDVVSGPVESICAAGGAASWALARNELYQTSGRQVKRLSPAMGPGVPDGVWHGLAAGKEGNLWLFGTSLVRMFAAGHSGILQEPALAAGDRITALCERSDGEVWFGTRNGELRRFGRYDSEARKPVAGKVRPGVRCIFEDRELNLWIGLEGGGLVRIKPKRVRSFGTRDGLPGERITGMCSDGKFGFWVGCHAGGIAHWSDGEFSRFTAGGTLPVDCIVWSLLRARDGSLWIGTEGAGLMHWKNGLLERFGPAGGVRQSAILAMAETPDGDLWIGGKGGELVRRTASGFVSYGPGQGFDGGSIAVLVADRDGGVWIGTDGRGIYHFADGKFTRFTRANGLADDHVRSLMLDAGGVLWIGTSGGLTRLKDGIAASFTTRDGLWDNVISQILQDTLDPVQEDQQLWLGSNRGIFRIRKTSFDDYLNGKITALEPVVYGRAEGMECLECSGGFSPAGLVQSPVENPGTKAVLLWFSTLRGLARLDVFPLVGRVRGISGDHLAFSKAHLHLGPGGTRFDLGDVVAGGSGFGGGGAPGINVADGRLGGVSDTASRTDPGKTAESRYHRTKLPFVDGVFIPDGSAVPGREAIISSTGLKAEFPATTGQSYGLLKSGFTPIGGDVFNPSEMRKLGSPIIWTSGNQGITFDLEMIRQATGRSIDRFTAQASNLHIGPVAMHVLLDGRKVAMRSGLVHDNDRFERGLVPLDIPIPKDARFLTLASTDDKDEIGSFNWQAPKVIIEEVRSDGIPQKPAARSNAAGGAAAGSLHPALDSVEIRPGSSRLDFRFAAPSLVAPEKVRFRYRLDPLEMTWEEAGDRRTAQYSHVPPGNYRFLVTACNNDGVWSPEGAAVALDIRPHFWQKGWFAPLWITCLTLAIIAATAFASGVRHRRHVRELERLNALAVERARIARDIHDDLGAGLTQVALLSDLARGDLAEPERAKVHLDQVFTVARRLARAVDEIVWAINPKNDALEFSFSYICKVAQDFLRAAGISCRLDLPESLPPGSLSSARRHQLYLVVLESLNNVVKHAAASEVRLRFLTSASELLVEIHDNGRGFEFPPVGPPSARHGLEGMAARMAEVGGKLEVTSQPGQGTVIRLRLPLQGRESRP